MRCASCILCGADSNQQPFCHSHLSRLACPTLLIDQITARPNETDDSAGESQLGWLTGWHGVSFPLMPGVIGRSAAAVFRIVHASVSAEHARVSKLEAGDSAGVTLEDLNSTNGTLVGSAPIGTHVLADGELVRFGEVPMVFSTRELTADSEFELGRQTVQAIVVDDAIALDLTIAGTAVDLTITMSCEGIVNSRSANATLGPLESELIKALALRRLQVPSSDLAFVSGAELLEQLPFQARNADQKNLRELVNRLRKKLAQADLPNLIESKRGVGYRLAGDVKNSAHRCATIEETSNKE